jgi:hypothetical protein
MKNISKILSIIWMLALSVGVIFPNFYSALFEKHLFGVIAFPSSLDVFVNPSAGDSVATFSHSQQHANENDAIEALEAKIGITASTPVSNSLLVSNNAGNSIWSSYASGTQAYFSNFFATASSTLQNFTFLNATGTAATTTNFFATTASTTNLWGTNINGFNLSTCSGTTFLQWSSGKFGCATPSIATNFSATTVSFTTSGYAAKTLSLTNGDVVMWWATCNRNAGNANPAIGYRTANDAATTTVFQGSGGDGSVSVSGSFTATTTYLATFEVVDSNGCDRGLEFTYFLIDG